MYNNIPQELQALTQWVVWKLILNDAGKPTKVPYSARTGQLASVTDPNTWCTFQEAVNASFNGYSGIGFVFTRNDPYAGIDLDATEDPEAFDRQLKIYNMMQSYSERSPSGKGLHIIVRATLPHGRKRAAIEVYSSERYFTFTGNVYLNAPIADRQVLTQTLWEEMGQVAASNYMAGDMVQQNFDDVVIENCKRAVNGDLFNDLWLGNWQHRYSSQSEADQALMNFLVFHTKHRGQIMRMFRMSALGQRDKAQRDKYLEYTIDKAFDLSLPPIDMDGIVNQVNAAIAQSKMQTPTATPASVGTDYDGFRLDMWKTMRAPGIIGEVVDFILAQAPYPVYEIALSGALGLMAGLSGRAYNVGGSGLNQYIMTLAATGSGKEAMSAGVNKIVTAVANTEYPAIRDFMGPSDMASGTGLIRHLSERPMPCFVSITGEIGLRLQQMSNTNANAGDITLRRTLLQLYQESGAGQTHQAMVYADKKNNVEPIHSPAFTWLGESTPEEFYKSLNEDQIASGLIPRFLIIEYAGDLVQPNDHHYKAQVPSSLIQSIRGLADTALKVMIERHHVVDVTFTAQAYSMHKQFRDYCNTKRVSTESNAFKHIWNRTHLKANKIAALLAIAHNYHNPMIDENMYEWAVSLVLTDAVNLVSKFDAGVVGVAENQDDEQLQSMRSAIGAAMRQTPGYFKNWPAAMHADYAVPSRFIQSICASRAAFRKDRKSGAIPRTVKLMIDHGSLAQLPYQQMVDKYGYGGQAYVIADAKWFMSSD